MASDNRNAEAAYQCLSRRGYGCSVVAEGADVLRQVAEKTPDLVLISADDGARIAELARDIKRGIGRPVVALLGRDALSGIEGHLQDLDDFVACPFDAAELDLRVRRLLRRNNAADSSEQINCGDLRIDLARCEVSVSGRQVVLTFKEYELLKYLMSNQGRVCTRETLLDRVWGYDYYGGDRTVDVHIRRLRSKIEDAGHTFVETVRNIGYRFRAEP